MQNRFVILKTSWGIAIIYDITETEYFDKSSDDVFKIKDNIYLKINKKEIDNESYNYLIKAIEFIANDIGTSKICFKINSLHYNECNYQPEGMYYMFIKWYYETHNKEISPINVYYDKETNKYIFPDLK